MQDFEPRIVGFLCNWCSYAGADLAGVSRFQYPPNIRIIRVMCSGRIDPQVVLKILERGADGVMITGCHIGDCHYIDGNLQTKRKFEFLTSLLEKAGLQGGRIILEWVSASEGQRFAEIVEKFTDHIRGMGPSPFSREDIDPETLLNMRAAQGVAEEFRLRALVGKEEKLLNRGNVYNEKVSEEDFKELLDEAIETQFIRQKIRLILIDNPSSVKVISDKIGFEAEKVLDHMVAMRQMGWIDVTGIDGTTPIYGIMEVG
jgi:coenzyme F420-reducing hydrogenase delta subunit